MNRLYYLTNTDRYYISEGLLLENPNQARKYLKDKNLDPDTNEMGQELLNDILNITKGDGYTHLLLKLYHRQRIDLDVLRDLYDYIKRNRGILKDLNKPVINYDSYIDLITDLHNLKEERFFKNFFKKLPKHLKRDFDDLGWSYQAAFRNTIKEFSKLSDEKQKGYEWKEVKRFKNIDEFNKRLRSYINAIQLGLSYNETINQIKNYNDAELVYVNPDEKIIIAHIKTFEASKKFGAPTAWCIKDLEYRFNEYKKGGKKYFFIWDYKLPIDDSLFMLGLAYKRGNIGASLMFNKPNKRVNPSTKLSEKNINISILDSYIEKRQEEKYESVKHIPIAKYLQENDDENLLESIRSSEFINEHGEPEDVEISRNYIELDIDENDLLEAFGIDEHDYSLLKSHRNIGAYDYHYFSDDEEANYMHGNLNEENIKLIKKLMSDFGYKEKYLQDIENMEGIIALFSNFYDLGLVELYMEEVNIEAKRVLENEANGILSNILFDIESSSITKENTLKIISDSGGEIKTFDDVMDKVSKLATEIEGYQDFYSDAIFNNMDYDNLNTQIKERLEYIFENIEDFMPDTDYSFDELIDKKLINDLGFKHTDDVYRKVTKDKTITISKFDFSGEKVKLYVSVIHRNYFEKTKQKEPKDVSGWMTFDTLTKYVQHYSMPGIGENNQLKRMKWLINK